MNWSLFTGLLYLYYIIIKLTLGLPFLKQMGWVRLHSWAAVELVGGPGTALGRATLHQVHAALSSSPSRSMEPWAAVLAGGGVAGPGLLQAGCRAPIIRWAPLVSGMMAGGAGMMAGGAGMMAGGAVSGPGTGPGAGRPGPPAPSAGLDDYSTDTERDMQTDTQREREREERERERREKREERREKRGERRESEREFAHTGT